jgi:AcrR family transcriptional regulator
MIEDTAVNLFGHKTYREITMVEIAEKAEISKRTLYKYYPSKAALFASIFEHYLHMLLDSSVSENFQNLSYGETLQSMLRQLYDFTKTQTSFMRLFWMLNSEEIQEDIPEELRRHINHWNVQIVEQAAAILREKTPRGLYKNFSPELAVHLFSAINKGIYLQITKETGLDIRSVNQEDLLNMFCAMLIRFDAEKL